MRGKQSPAFVVSVNGIAVFHRDRAARISVKRGVFCKQEPVSFAVDVHRVAFLNCRNYHKKNTPFTVCFQTTKRV